MNLSSAIWFSGGFLTLIYALQQPYNKGSAKGISGGIACLGLLIAWPVFWLVVGIRLLIKVVS